MNLDDLTPEELNKLRKFLAKETKRAEEVGDQKTIEQVLFEQEQHGNSGNPVFSLQRHTRILDFVDRQVKGVKE